MGGHGGLNILPQKKWHVFNYDNRLKVELDQLHAREADAEKQIAVAKLQSERVFNTLRGDVPVQPAATPKPGNLAYEKEAQAAKDAQIMRSTMYLGQTVSHQSAPWYNSLGKTTEEYDFASVKSADCYSIIPKKVKKHKKHSKVHPPKVSSSRSTIEELRAARLRREATERKKTEMLLQQRTQ